MFNIFVTQGMRPKQLKSGLWVVFNRSYLTCLITPYLCQSVSIDCQQMEHNLDWPDDQLQRIGGQHTGAPGPVG